MAEFTAVPSFIRHTRSPAVAGTFYPADPRVLFENVSTLLTNAESVLEDGIAALKFRVLIVPHAGYIYSGAIAASAYILLKSRSQAIRRVVLLGPAHRVWIHGLAVPQTVEFATPLGLIPLDKEAIRGLRSLPQVIESEAAHLQEHSLEVQLPFLQVLLPSFTLVPLVVGEASSEEVAQVLEPFWNDPQTLILISSDLSHYLAYDHARRVDQQTVDKIMSLDSALNHDEACGATPINGLLLLARCHQLQPHLLDLRNSGDTAGTREQVVGYTAVGFNG